jgi:hypothetical protein
MLTRAPLLAVLTAAALGACSIDGVAQETAPPRTAQDIALSAKTPLGEASITLPADTEVTNYVEEGATILLRQGPFAAGVPTEQIIFTTNAPTTTNAPIEPPPVAAEQAAQTPNPAPSTTPTDPAAGPAWVKLPEEWKALWPFAVIALLAAYSLLATVALLRTRGRRTRDSTPSSPALPAVVTGDGNSIACPLCAKDIAVAKLQSGRNNCPACRGAFVVERP